MNEYLSLEDELYSDPHAWRDYARCLDPTPEEERILFPWGRPEPTDNETDFYMSENCFQCPVRIQCLRFAAKTESIGIWGGHRLDLKAATKLGSLYKEDPGFNLDDADQVLREDEDEPD